MMNRREFLKKVAKEVTYVGSNAYDQSFSC